MTSLEKSIKLGYLFLTYKPKKKPINTRTSFFCMYWYFSISPEKYFWPQYMYLTLSPNNGFCWCPLGKLFHLGLEQLTRALTSWVLDFLYFLPAGMTSLTKIIALKCMCFNFFLDLVWLTILDGFRRVFNRWASCNALS